MLFTYDNQQGIKPVSPNNQADFDQISQETEELYLPDYLGRSFAYDVQKNPSNYTDLLEGVEFEDCDGETIMFKGLNYIFAYFIYAEYLAQTKYKDTNTGFVLKNRDEATQTTQGQEAKLQNKNRKFAESEIEVMRQYLNENTDTYTLWNCTTKGRSYTPKLMNIKKTKS